VKPVLAATVLLGLALAANGAEAAPPADFAASKGESFSRFGSDPRNALVTFNYRS
jgi:hypothetical protein